ncbi:unnamed protein product, partial [Mesorhabditis belari]|uniref:Uncharacterized protein n=1 Tax=Mesorhabditis belari TaxID=2138241 RepID=A0AAF3EPD8_9BILA
MFLIKILQVNIYFTLLTAQFFGIPYSLIQQFIGPVPPQALQQTQAIIFNENLNWRQRGDQLRGLYHSLPAYQRPQIPRVPQYVQDQARSIYRDPSTNLLQKGINFMSFISRPEVSAQPPGRIGLDRISGK